MSEKIDIEIVLSFILRISPTIYRHLDTKTWCNLRQVSKRIYEASKEGIMELLLPHQIIHYREIRNKIFKYHRVVDTSMMGCGKTYISCALARDLNLTITVFAPAQTKTNWLNACKHFNIEESRLAFWPYSVFQRRNKPYLTKLEDKSEGMTPEEKSVLFRANEEWLDRVAKGTLLVLDESHWLKNVSNRSKIAIILTRSLLECHRQRSYLMCLSATPFDKMEHSIRLCRVLGIIKQENLAHQDPFRGHLIYEGLQDLIDYCEKLENKKLPPPRYYYYGSSKSGKLAYDYILRYIKPRMFRSMPQVIHKFTSDTKNLFCHLAGQDLDIVSSGVKLLQNALAAFHINGGANGQALASVTRGMKTIEGGKVQTFVRLAKSILLTDPKAKVVIMLNYIDSIDEINDKLKEFNPLVVKGKTSMMKRFEYISQFQELNTNHRVLISNLSILAQGVDLDDKDGNFPRYMLISPSYHIINLHQATGRVLRTHTRSNPVIRFVYIDQVKAEMTLLHKLANKSKTIRTGLNYTVNLPGDYEQITEQTPYTTPNDILNHLLTPISVAT